MKKILIAVSIVVCMLVLACCGDQEKTEEELTSEGTDTKCEVEYNKYSGEHSAMFLSKGDKVAVISPSALPTREQTDAVVDGLKDWGYEPVEGKHVCEETRTLDDIIADLEWALKDSEIKAIYCVRGGYGSSEVVDELPAKLISESNKLIIGYSDITTYISAWAKNGLPSIHGGMSGAFGGLPEDNFTAVENILIGKIPSYKCESSSYCKEGTAEGVLIGGNLSTFNAVIGSAYDCTKSGQPYIIFLEDVGEDIQHIHRYLTVLKHAGVLDRASGIVFGGWTEIPKDMGDYSGNSRGGEFKSVADMISRQFLGELDIPVAFGFPAGHGDVNYPLLMGEMAELKVTPKEFTLVCGTGK